jgi:hypothetical protein
MKERKEEEEEEVVEVGGDLAVVVSLDQLAILREASLDLQQHNQLYEAQSWNSL